MALTVEDGSVVSGAESYVTVIQFKAYCDARGISYSGLTDTQIEQNARKAWDYLLQKYRGTWKGYRKSALQLGDWPRSFVYLEPFVHGGAGSFPFLVDEDTIPLEVKTAQYELMLRVENNDLTSDLGPQEKSVTIGPISIEYNTNSDEQTRYEAVDSMLRIYLGTSTKSGNFTVRRA